MIFFQFEMVPFLEGHVHFGGCKLQIWGAHTISGQNTLSLFVVLGSSGHGKDFVHFNQSENSKTITESEEFLIDELLFV